MTATVTIPAHKLRTLLASVIPACAPASAGTPVLSAIRIKTDVGGWVEASATNRYIVAQNTLRADTYAGAGSFTLRAEDAKQLISALPKTAPRAGVTNTAIVNIEGDEMSAEVRVGATTATYKYRAQEGDYPATERLLIDPDKCDWPEPGVGIGFTPARLAEITKCAQAINRNAAIVFNAQAVNTKPVALRIDHEDGLDWRGLIMPARI